MNWAVIWLVVSLYFYCLTSARPIQSRVFGGEDLDQDAHRYLVKLNLFHSHGNGVCSGVIIDTYWILSSAHCFKGIKETIVVTQETFGVSEEIATVEISNVHLHPKWIVNNVSLMNRAYDIAILKTNREIQFNEYVQPIKLATENPKNGQTATISGYGQSEFDYLTPRQGTGSVYNCFEELIHLLCTTDLIRAGSGDSGGPLVSNNRLIGVTSGSCKNVIKHEPCTTVYTSVIFNNNWILDVMRNN